MSSDTDLMRDLSKPQLAWRDRPDVDCHAMGYSWTKFGVGVLAGLVAFALLFVATSYIYLSFPLLLISNILIVQAPKTARAQNSPMPSSSDADEWRQFGREAVKGIRDAILPVTLLVSLIIVWDLVVRRYPFLGDLPRKYGESLLVMLLTAVWVARVIAAFRAGQRRRLSSA